MTNQETLTLALSLHHCRGGNGPALARAIREAGSLAALASLIRSGAQHNQKNDQHCESGSRYATHSQLSLAQLALLADAPTVALKQKGKKKRRGKAPESGKEKERPREKYDAIVPLGVRNYDENSRLVQRDLEWSNQEGCTLLCYDSEGYPAQLRETDCPPLLLYVRGSLEALSVRQLAIVGSRRASEYGKRNAYWMARELSAAGIGVCSGLALGIDAQAHGGALDAVADCHTQQAAPTVAVIGTGIDRIYPARHAGLSEKIAANGALVSEFPLGTLAYPYNFPRRNRLISGLSEGVLVVEAAIRSGSLITARCALEQNRDVYAMPGLLSNPQGRGCHSLIKQGAMLVDEPADILKDFGVVPKPAQSDAAGDLSLTKTPWHHSLKERGKSHGVGTGLPHDLAPLQRHLLQRLRTEDCLFDSLLDANVADFHTLNHALLDLEVRGLVACRGGRYTIA